LHYAAPVGNGAGAWVCQGGAWCQYNWIQPLQSETLSNPEFAPSNRVTARLSCPTDFELDSTFAGLMKMVV
jgi:hypothetical protein